ncbi:MAG: DUF1592 domain-containing protein [Vicinamibacterales bacterium]
MPHTGLLGVLFAALSAVLAGTVPGGALLAAQRSHATRRPLATQRPAAAPDRALLDRYCLSCHVTARKLGGVDLSAIEEPRAGADADLWERIVRQVRSGVMPPAGAPRPDAATRARFVEGAERAIDVAAAARPRPGRPVAHRLNRAEYANAVRDVLALEIDAAALLPADESLDGFDNIGGVLSLSPLLVDRYLSAARQISRLAVGDLSITPAFAARTYQAAQTAFQDARTSEDLPFGARGGMVVRHQFPLDAEYIIRVALLRNILGYVRGLTEPHLLEIRLDGRRLARMTVGGMKAFRPAPLSYTGVILGDPQWEAWAVTADDGLEVRFRAAAGPHVVGVYFVDEPHEREGVQQQPLTGLGFAYSEFSSAPWGPWGPAVNSVTVDGPINPTGSGTTPSRSRLFVCRPSVSYEEDACARGILATTARRAYRRPVDSADIEPLMTFFHRGRREAGTFDGGIQAAIERLLMDPGFLFRIEREPKATAPGAAYRVSDVELASRLSFFLWSSVPDDPLLDLAERGALGAVPALKAEVSRLLADERSRTLVDNFAMQWLGLRQLRMATLDEEILPEYDGSLREAFLRETALFMADQIRQDRPVLELLTATHTFVNERLAKHYGIPGVYGGHFRRVSAGGQRAGLLGHGSVLTTTSYPTRTSPVLRGRWLLENLMGTPPPPPPPTIPPLPGPSVNNRPLSMRQRTERHRANPACAGCHARMDPLGFALENFDAIGRWRTHGEDGAPVDAAGALPDGTTFTGVEGIRQLIAAHPEEFVRTLTGKLLTYALGRALEPSDMPALRGVVRDAARSGYRWSALIEGIVTSVPFQMRQAS